MGDVAKAEFTAWADFYDEFGRLPRFNNKGESPKFNKRQTEQDAAANP